MHPHRPPAVRSAAATITLALALAGCASKGPLGVEIGLDSGIQVHAVAHVTGPDEDGLQTIRGEVAFTNGTAEPLVLAFRGCALLLHLRSGGEIVWRQEEAPGFQCHEEPYELHLEPGGTQILTNTVRTWEILGIGEPFAPQPAGVYDLVLVIRMAEASRPVDVGRATLTLGLDGLVYDAVAAPTGTRPDTLVTTVEVTNGGSRAIRVEYGACAVQLLLFADPERIGDPIWDSRQRRDAAGFPLACPAYLATDVLEPGRSISPPEFRLPIPVAEILGGSVEPGRYHLTALLQINFGTVAIPAGTVDLAR